MIKIIVIKHPFRLLLVCVVEGHWQVLNIFFSGWKTVSVILNQYVFGIPFKRRRYKSSDNIQFTHLLSSKKKPDNYNRQTI